MIENLRELIQELETETETPSIQELEKLLKDGKYIKKYIDILYICYENSNNKFLRDDILKNIKNLKELF